MQYFQTARQLRPAVAIAYWAHFFALKRAILVLLNAVMSQVPTGLSAGSRVFNPMRTG